ncbi:hypothetical protein JD79_02665 [Geodermatophilus normandii]|uniref:Uncharacterized protein n=1 Tax=Geodermatophilus normandii TaxID=1137989 RepID=A0A317QLC3_9ACTN|nr:hypothetical protein [Geodermatophilus normandii]PWW23491.1 hypothetical protein JD79_02665 [Geodermatophilus normandii]
MSTLEEHLDDLAPAPAIRTLATTLAAETAVESDRQEQYVSLRPSMEGAVAVYLHRTWVSIAVEPDEAAAVAARLPEATVHPKTPATTYLHLTAEALAGAPDAALSVAREAVAWRAAGPRSSVGTGSAKKVAQPVATCPSHWMALLPSGACPVCG